MRLFGRKDKADEPAEAPPPEEARVEELPPPDAEPVEAVEPPVPTPEEPQEIAADPEPLATPEPAPAIEPSPVSITSGPAASSAPGAGEPSLPVGGDLAQQRPEVLVAAAFAGAFIFGRILKRITSD